MNVALKFDYEQESRLLYISDGYVSNLRRIYEDFFEWLYCRTENISQMSDGGFGCAYGAEDFLEYINSVVLKEANERAYFLRHGRADRQLTF